MSRLKERREKNCLNCQAEVQGRYCHNCGQENIEPKETIWHLISHFFKDITHFDGNFFSTVKYLVVKPGFLSKEYMIGRRASYVNPVRLYIFTSAFFFLIFFSFFKMDKKILTTGSTMNGKTYPQIEMMDSLTFDAFTKNVNKEDGKKEVPMSRAGFKNYFDSSVESAGIHFTPTRYRSQEQYDSILKTGKKNHNWWQRQLIYKEIEINNKFRNNPGELLNTFSNILLHSLPQLLFISLPMLALLLKLLYIRRKEFYYVNHGIFSLHLYIFTFIALLAIFSLNKLNSELHWWIISAINFLLYVSLFFYEYKAMRNFYKQRRAKTIIKFILLNLMFFVLLSLLFTIFIFFSFLKL
jgi:hypothetical protein